MAGVITYYSPQNGIQPAVAESMQQTRFLVNYMVSVSDAWRQQVSMTIGDLQQWEPAPEENLPEAHLSEITANPPPEQHPPDPDMFGVVGPLAGTEWQDFLSLVDEFEPYDPGEFDDGGMYPVPPEPPEESEKPEKPDEVDLGQEPNMPPEYDPGDALPAPPELLPIDNVDIPKVDLPDLDLPEIEPLPESPELPEFDYEPTDYDPLLVNELAASIKLALDGGYAMPREVQDAIMAAARDRAAAVVGAAVEAAYDDFAGRGFPMPPGMLAENVNAARERNELESHEANRTAMVRASEWAVENLRTAWAQGIALEHAWVQVWNSTEQRAFQTAQTLVELVKDHFNMRVAYYNSQLAHAQLAREVYEAKLRAALSRLERAKLELENEQLKGQVNETAVRQYVALLDGIKTLAEIAMQRYERVKAQLEIRGQKLEQEKLKVDKWSKEIDAWTAERRALTSEYESKARVEVSKTAIIEANARAYAATVAAAADRNQARNKVVDAKMRAIEASVSKFNALLGSNVAKVNAERDAVTARAQAYSAAIGFQEARMRHLTQAEENKVRAQEANARTKVAYYDAYAKQFESRQQRLMIKAGQLKDAMTSIGDMASNMTAGATSAISAQVSLQGSGSSNWNHSINNSYPYSWD